MISMIIITISIIIMIMIMIINKDDPTHIYSE
jgi:hypothetical protein